MIRKETRTVITGNLLDMPSGKSYSDVRLGENCDPADMIHTTRIPNKMSQRSFYEYVKDILGEQVTIKISRVGRPVWSHTGPIESVRGWAYYKAMEVGATHGRRDGSKPEEGYTFEISEASN